jgi:hypothetical protein
MRKKKRKTIRYKDLPTYRPSDCSTWKPSSGAPGPPVFLDRHDGTLSDIDLVTFDPFFPQSLRGVLRCTHRLTVRFRAPCLLGFSALRVRFQP